jgi:putative copper export protein
VPLTITVFGCDRTHRRIGACPRKADVYTIENLFKFLHVLAVVVWVGGVLTVNVLQVLTGRGQERAAKASLLRLSDLYGRAVIAPAAALTLVTGLVRVEQIDVGYGTLWVAWGIAAIAGSLALGATLIRATNAALRRLAAEAAVDDPRWPTLQRRAATLYGINLLLLLSALWAMEFKPTL